MESGCGSSTGRVRELNEDVVWCDGRLAVVADGMGGAAAGEVAANLAVETVKGWPFPSGDAPIQELEQAALRAVGAANRAIYERASADPDLKGMGTTITAVILGRACAVVAHVGDSRAYHVRAGRLHPITRDHSVVAELLRSGGITAEQARRHPYRNMLTRALGPAPYVDVDIHTVSLDRDDGIFLCTDGLTSLLTDEEIAGIIREAKGAQAAVDALIAEANDRGAPDNVSAILVYPGGSVRD